MKRLFLLAFVLLSVSFSSWAQVKIALLEPRVSSSSAGVTDMEKAMIRGELRKAIVNHGGYEAFTRADIDQLMKEQDFQRTGMVSETDIKRLGEMSGADYICVSTLSKSNAEFYLEAYLINIETGSISNPASQYGELKNGKLANMLDVCKNLAIELISGTSGSSESKVKEKIQYDRERMGSRRSEVQTINPTKKPSTWWGINASLLVLSESEFVSFGCNLDMAFSINESIAVGGRVKLSWDSYYYEEDYSYYDYYYDTYSYNYYTEEYDGVGVWIGPELKYTFPKNNALIFGVGYAGLCSFNLSSVYLQLGYKTKKSFYFTIESLVAGDVTGFEVGLGFSFGGKRTE